METVQKNVKKGKRDKKAELEIHFSYLPKAERDKLLYGSDFVPVPKEELKRLKIDVYPYLM